MDENHNRRKTDGMRLRPIRLAFIILTIVFFLILAGFAKVLHDVQGNSGRINDLVEQNSQRIEDIQKSRVESCERTYLGIKQVFAPFTPPLPRSPKQQADLEKFNATIEHLRNACIIQTAPKHIPKGGNN